MELRVTAAGRAALADTDDVGVRQVSITHVRLGAGVGPGGADDDARQALRSPRDSAGARAATAAPARIAVRGDVLASSAYTVTEVGIDAAVDGGAPFLFAYWTGGGAVLAAAAPGVTVLVVATLDVVSDVPAMLAVADAPAVALAGASAFGWLSDVAGLTANRYYRANAGGTVLEQIDAPGVLSELLGGLDDGDWLRLQEAGGVRSLEGLTSDELGAALRA